MRNVGLLGFFLLVTTCAFAGGVQGHYKVRSIDTSYITVEMGSVSCKIKKGIKANAIVEDRLSRAPTQGIDLFIPDSALENCQPIRRSK